jgi:(p)ppGpp synthase/HD superfamily hydrolase
MKLVEEAFAFAFLKHKDQLRKYTNEPYIVHPIAVADLVRTINARDEMVAAALLHDVLEDTDATPDELRALFGDEVTNLVIDLTDVFVDTELHGNRKIRKAKEAERLAGVSADAQTIKVADMIDNTKTIVAHDPGFARVYLREKAALFKVLTKAHPALLAMAM